MTKITLVKDARDKEMLRLTDMLENAQSLMCAIGNAFGGGFSGKIEPFRIHDKSQTEFPYIDNRNSRL